MRKSRFGQEQIIGVLKEAGRIGGLCRAHGSSAKAYYKWKAKYRGLGVSEARRLKELEDENRRLKQIVPNLTLDNQILKNVVSKRW